MTTPEDRDLWERDEEALRAPAPVDLMRSEAARVARYAEAMHREFHKFAPVEAIPDSPDPRHRIAACYACIAAAPMVVAVADEEHAALVAEVERLRWWKREASEVILGLQGLGKALDLPLGERITGEAAADAASALVARAEVAEAERARLRQDRDEWKQSTIAANRRFEAAEAKVAKIEALIPEQWQIDGGILIRPEALRAALADAPAEQRADGGA
jgi:hypothetical protein